MDYTTSAGDDLLLEVVLRKLSAAFGRRHLSKFAVVPALSQPIPRDGRNRHAANTARNNQILWLWIPGRRPPALSRWPGTTAENFASAYHPHRTGLVVMTCVVLTCTFSFSRRVSRPSYVLERPSSNQRAQGRPGAGRTRGPRAAKKHAAEPQVRPNNRPSPRDDFTVYTRSPRGPAFLSPSSATLVMNVATLAPAPGRQNHATSPSASHQSSRKSA